MQVVLNWSALERILFIGPISLVLTPTVNNADAKQLTTLQIVLRSRRDEGHWINNIFDLLIRGVP